MRNYLPHTIDETVIRLWGSRMADISNTYVHNLTRTAKHPSRFERAAVNDRISEERAARVPQIPRCRRPGISRTARRLAHRARSRSGCAG